jgi:hypothetical protein
MEEHKRWYASAVEEIERRIAALDEREKAILAKEQEVNARKGKIEQALAESGLR